MIFDAEDVKVLVVEWQRTSSSAVLEAICDKSNRLIEVVVSCYDPIFRDDMIQECRLRLISGALQGYDKAYSLHTYLTTVFHNVCKTYMKKQYRISNLYEDYDILEEIVISDTTKGDIIDGAICRNRERFPSLPADVIDDLTEYIVIRLAGNVGKKRGVVAELMKNFYVSRNIATIVYHSTIIYLRKEYDGNLKNTNNKFDEFSLVPDLCDTIGESAVRRLILLFSGMCVRLP